MKYLLSFMMLALSMMSMQAAESSHALDSLHNEKTVSNALSVPLECTYLKNVCEGGHWDRNWFIEMKSGASAFLGSPFGQGNIFDHTMPVLQVGVGKWLTPGTGGRIVYQGLQFKNANLDKMHYQFFHADFLWNITGTISKDSKGVSQLGIIPFVGVGLIRNADWERICECNGSVRSSHPFAFSYGIQFQYPILQRLNLVAEISGMSTLKNFDRVSTSEDFGEHMLNISAGLSITLGKTGWKKVLDARPYIQQNKRLMEEIAILRGQVQNATAKAATSSLTTNGKALCHDGISSDTILLDVPVYFYFKKNTASLVNTSQLSNLDEIAHLVKGTAYSICITGAADCATGTDMINQKLSEARAKYIALELVKRGVAERQIKTIHFGGIDKFAPIEANRHTCIKIVR